MEYRIKIHIVDDEIAIVNTLEKLINKMFPNSDIVCHYDGDGAWELIKHETSPFILLTDLNMPGISGLQLITNARKHEIFKDSYIIVISSSVDPEVNVRTLKQGADDFLNKPFSVDQLIVKMRAAMRVMNLFNTDIEQKNKLKVMEEEMEKSNEAMFQQIIQFQSIRLPEYKKRLPNIIRASNWIAKNLCETENEIKNITRAAEICYCGKLFLNEKLVELPVMNRGLVVNKVMNDVPKFASELLKPIKNTEKINQILYHIYENLDGTGIPENKKSWEIPLGSRILRVAIDFEDLYKKYNENQGKTIEAMFIEAKRLYDHRVLAYYDQHLGYLEFSTVLGKKGREYTVEIHELDEQMVTSRNIITSSGLILVAPGININAEKIERIRTINQSDNIIGKIYILNK